MINNAQAVILTGASGFIGSHLVNRLIELGFLVIAVTRSLEKNASRQCDNLFWIQWSDIEEFLRKNQPSPIAIIHLATAYGRSSESLASIEEANVIMPLNLLELAVKYKIKKFINTDSYFTKPEFNYQYMRPYIITKDSFRKWGEFTSSHTDLHFVNMRLEHVYGPGDGKGKFIPYIIESLYANKDFIECTDCTQKRDFIYVDDVVSAYLTILNKDLPTKYLECEVGCGVSMPLKFFLEKIKEKIKEKKHETRTILKFGSLKQRDNEILESKAEISLLESLGWKPEVDYLAGISKTLEHHI
ncbi:NAD-dependent epimerase/dehydratase family protein [Aeromonas hydrophila]|uniref:NAD-dependent epimerase/dehydratase family protein n=1 Tax=Aeromonas hydrophila TaxID=644 RepID=UPI0036DBB884